LNSVAAGRGARGASGAALLDAFCAANGALPARCVVRCGFTLIELMVVLLVMSILAASVVPSFMSSARAASVKAAATKIADLLDFAYAAAIARRQPVTVNLDLGRNMCWVSVLAASLPWLGEGEGPETRTLASIQLPEDFEIALQRGSEAPAASRTQQQWETIRFDPDGMAEDVLIEVADRRGEEWTIEVQGTTGEVALQARGKEE